MWKSDEKRQESYGEKGRCRKTRKSGQKGEKRNYDGEKGRETTGPSSILLDGTVLSLAHVLSSLSKTQPPGHCEEILASNVFVLWL